MGGPSYGQEIVGGKLENAAGEGLWCLAATTLVGWDSGVRLPRQAINNGFVDDLLSRSVVLWLVDKERKTVRFDNSS